MLKVTLIVVVMTMMIVWVIWQLEAKYKAFKAFKTFDTFKAFDTFNNTSTTTIDFYLSSEPNKRVVTVLDTYKIFFIYSTTIQATSLSDLDASVTVSYTTDVEKYLFQVALLSQGLDKDRCKLVKEAALADVYCSLVPYDVSLSLFSKLSDAKTTIIGYDQVDTAKVAYFVPFMRYKGVDFIYRPLERPKGKYKYYELICPGESGLEDAEDAIIDGE
jgi:hypothetical protein